MRLPTLGVSGSSELQLDHLVFLRRSWLADTQAATELQRSLVHIHFSDNHALCLGDPVTDVLQYLLRVSPGDLASRVSHSVVIHHAGLPLHAQSLRHTVCQG